MTKWNKNKKQEAEKKLDKMIKESKRFGREDEERGEGEKVKETRK